MNSSAEKKEKTTGANEAKGIYKKGYGTIAKKVWKIKIWILYQKLFSIYLQLCWERERRFSITKINIKWFGDKYRDIGKIYSRVERQWLYNSERAQRKREIF